MFAKAVSGSPQSMPQESLTDTSSMVSGAGVSLQSSNILMSFPGVSPGKAVDLQMKN